MTKVDKDYYDLDSNVDLQYWLKMKGFYKGQLDNKWGPLSDKAFLDFLESRTNNIVYNWKNASFARNIVAVKQLIMKEATLDVGPIDGLWGPQTEFASKSFEHFAKTGEPLILRDTNGLLLEPELPIVSQPDLPEHTVWPYQKDVQKFFGPVGSNQALLEVPYEHRLAWDTSTQITRYSCHEKVHDPIKRVLTRVLDHYGEEQIKALRLDLFGGCLNVRKMRGGTSWSMHSWGIACDYDPAHNRLLQNHTTAAFAHPQYHMWFRLWEEEGFVSLGRQRDYDWMHVQAARL